MTLNYLKTHVQFGGAIGNYQRLPNAAEMDAGQNCGRTFCRAKTRPAYAAILVAREAMQQYDAVGYNNQADIGLFLHGELVLVPRYASVGNSRERHGSLSER
ncbi:hypothetical protein [Bradyrhizobium sp. USDA 4529]